MLTMNRATLVGHAGRDPEIRDLPNGGRAAAFPLATAGKWTDREGNPVKSTDWHRIVVYGATAEIVRTMLRKGDPVMVEGRVATRKYNDREGIERSVTEIVVAGPRGMVNVLAARRQDPGSEAGAGSGSEAGAGTEQ